MSFDDFCLCTPSEFRSIYESWRKREESMARLAWERTRTEVTAIFQIMSKKALDKHKIMPFDWDNKDTQPAKKTAPSTRERVQELKERLKNKKKTCHPTL